MGNFVFILHIIIVICCAYTSINLDQISVTIIIIIIIGVQLNTINQKQLFLVNIIDL